MSGCREGQTASTLQPAFAKAMTSLAVGYQRWVVTTRTVGPPVVGEAVPAGCAVSPASSNINVVALLMGFGKPGRGKSEIDQGSALAKRLGCGLQHLDYAEAGFAVVGRDLVLHDAIDEVRQLAM